MKPTERFANTPSPRTGLFALLCHLLSVKGSGAFKINPGTGVPSPRGARVTLALSAAALGLLAFTAAPALAGAPEAPGLKVEHVFASTAVFQGTLSPGAAEPAEGTYRFLYKASKTKECKGGSETTPGVALGGAPEVLPPEQITGLAPSTEYAVCLRVENESLTATSPPLTFRTAAPAKPELPEATGVTERDATTAILNGVLNPLKEGEPGKFSFIYNEAPGGCEQPGASESEQEPASSVSPLPVQLPLFVLKPGTNYNFCVKAINALGESTISAPAHFTTAITPEQPAAEASAVTATTATLKGVLNPNHKGDPGTYEFHYRQSPTECEGPGEVVVPGSATGVSPEPVEAAITGFLPGMPYTFCLRVVNEVGEETTGPQPPVTFTTEAVPPSLQNAHGEESEHVLGVEATSATLAGEVNPGGAATSYDFEYGTSKAYGQSVPVPAGSLAAGDTSRPVSAPVTGLEPNKTYYYRLVARNSAAPAGVQGVAKTLTTPVAPGSEPQNCPGEALRRQENSAQLPDCRAYEMVSPLDKNGANIAAIKGVNGGGVVQAAADGHAVTYVSLGSFAAPQGAPVGSQYLSERQAGVGWLARNITIPMNDQTYALTGAGTPYDAFSEDLTIGLVNGGDRGNGGSAVGPVENPPLTPEAPAGYEDFYLSRLPGGELQSLLTHAPDESPEGFTLEFIGATSDLNHAVVRVSAALEGEAAGTSPELYEWERNTGRFQPVSLLPDGAPPSEGAALGGDSPGETGQAISANGSQVVWTAEQGLFVREGIGTPAARTIQADAPAGGGRFMAASGDGSRVFFADTQKLTADSTATGEGLGDLYMFEPQVGNSGHLVDLTVDHIDANGAGVQGVLGTSADGSYVYFVANGVLATEPGVTGVPPSEGDCRDVTNSSEEVCNLYLWHAGWEKPRFITTLSREDESESLKGGLGVAQDWQSSFGLRTTRVSVDGQSLLFMSQQSLKTDNFPEGYDSTISGGGASCGLNGTHEPLPAQCQEVYLYQAQGAGSLSCVSCNPTGAQPIGPSGIPGGTEYALDEAVYQSRALSEDGATTRVFFDSADSLVPGATGHAENVYEYENGKIYLLSDGSTPSGASFVDASVNGDDVFFITGAELVPQDTDQSVDLYDARAPHEPGERVGFPVAPSVACQGEGCRPPAAGAPGVESLATTVLSGSGNLTPGGPAIKPVAPKPAPKPVPKCRKPRKLSHAKCVKPKKTSKKTGRASRSGRTK